MDYRHNKIPAKALSNQEVNLTLSAFRGQFAIRNRALFSLMTKTGFRVSEALSLRIRDVWQYGQVLDLVTVSKNNMKGKIASRAVPLHNQTKAYLGELIGSMGEFNPDDFLFQSQRGTKLSRYQVDRIFDEAFRLAQVTDPRGTHTCRKYFAESIYERSGRDIHMTSRLLGHSSVTMTQKYLSVNVDRVKQAVLGD